MNKEFNENELLDFFKKVIEKNTNIKFIEQSLCLFQEAYYQLEAADELLEEDIYED